MEISVPENGLFNLPSLAEFNGALVSEKMVVQFTLSRMFQLVAVAAILCSLFASLEWPVALALLCVTNGFAAIVFLGMWRLRTAFVAGFTSILIAAALFFSGYGLDSPHP